MTRLNEIYQCEYCGNTVRIIQAGTGTLVCCGVEMNKVDKWFPEAVAAIPDKPNVRLQ